MSRLPDESTPNESPRTAAASDGSQGRGGPPIVHPRRGRRPAPLGLPVGSLALLALLASPALADEYVVEATAGLYRAPDATAVTRIGPGQDDSTVTVTLPFEFPFFGRLYDRVSVSTDGWLSLGATLATESTNPVLPSTAVPNGVVAPLWDDLKTGTGSVVTFSPTPGVFVVSWEGVDTFAATSSSVLTFQVALTAADGTIEFAYGQGGTWDGLSYTAGIESPDGLVAFGGPGFGNDNTGRPADDIRFVANAVTVGFTPQLVLPVASETGLGGSMTVEPRGVRYALYREDDGLPASRSATVRGLDGGVTLRLDVETVGARAVVQDAGGVTHRHTLATGIASTGAPDLGTLTIDAAADSASPAIRRAMSIALAIDSVQARLEAMLARSHLQGDPQAPVEDLGVLAVQFVPDLAQPSGTSYTPAAPMIPARLVVNDGASNRDPFDPHVVVREYAHHVLAVISAHPGALPSRSFTAPVDPGSALADGFAHWLAGELLGVSRLVDTTGPSSATVIDLEPPTPAPQRNPSVTGAVASALFDLTDPADETHDLFEGTSGFVEDLQGVPSTAQQVFEIFDRALDALPQGQAAFTSHDFLLAFAQGRPDAERAAISRLFVHDGASQDDAREPDDAAGEEKPFPGGDRKITGLRLSPHNEDRFTLVLSDPDAASLAVSAARADGATEFEVELFDATGVLLARDDNVGAVTEALVRAEAAGPLPAGTYEARVRWLAGDNAGYDIRFSTPLGLATASLPEWTAGLPYKQDLVATGGVPPYVFATTVDAPGLASQASGTRVGGTPTTAGDFVVGVSLTDDDAPASALTSTLPLRINPALSLPGLVGVPALRPFDVAIGTGGTGTTWATGTLPPVGLTLSGGAELRLSGESAPQTFVVSGGATDTVGAAIGPADATVVVCTELGRSGEGGNPADAVFGFYFDALAGSRVNATFLFRGQGESPRVMTVIDDRGAALPFDGALSERGRRSKLRGLRVERTARHYVIFHYPGEGRLAGTYRTSTRVRPPRKDVGQIAIDVEGEVEFVEVEALAGSILRVRVVRGNAPTSLRPVILGIDGPDGEPVTDTPRLLRSNRGKVIRLLGLSLPVTGIYRVRIGGATADGSIAVGPLVWSTQVDPPRGATLELD